MSKCLCPNCGRANMNEFWEMQDLPVHSVLLMPTRDEAVQCPRGEIALGYCSGCGFVANTRFDASFNEYSPRYEETQWFSDTFSSWAKTLAEQLVHEYGLRNKTILEIGCGKGDFLKYICELSGSQGIGIDPSFVPDRLKSVEELTFITDFYSEKYSHYDADLILCRHVLEHIAPTGRFIDTIRRTIGTRMETLVFFEVPDFSRVLREGAFWDVYYEHCSYFTDGSLRQLFSAAGFEILDTALGFDNQYLLLVARPSGGGQQPPDFESSRAEIKTLVAGYSAISSKQRILWLERIRAFHSAGKRVVLWGGGSKTVAFLTTLGLKTEVEFVVDINPYKQGRFLPGTGQLVVGPEHLVRFQPDLVISMNPIYCEEIRKDLEKLDLSPTFVAV